MDDAGADGRKLLIDSYLSHVDHIRVGQARRFEILRYAFAGFFAYYAFLLGIDSKLHCRFPFEFVVLVPSFMLAMVFCYIWIVNMNIAKHGDFIGYLFRTRFEPMGMGENAYREFLETHHFRRAPFAATLNSMHLHSSQGVVASLALGTLVLYWYLERNGALGLIGACVAKG